MAETRLPFAPQSFDISVDGPPYQAVINAGTASGQIAWPGTIAIPGTAGVGTFVSAPVPTAGMPHLAVSAQLSTAGSLIVKTYLDAAGSIVAGAGTNAALTANTLEVLDFVDAGIMGSVVIELIDTGTAVGMLTNNMLILQSK